MPLLPGELIRALHVAALIAVTASAGGAQAAALDATRFAPEFGVDLARVTRLASGLAYTELVEGAGAPARRDRRVEVRYRAYLADGTPVDSTPAAGPPFAFRVGTRDVIKAWNEGVTGMREGGVRRLLVPPSLGYGSRAAGAIPARSVLVFDIQLVRAF